MSAATPAPKLAIPPCATCDHPIVRAFVELVSAAESKAPAWVVLDACKALALFGYKIDLVAPADDHDMPPAEWCWYLKDGRIASGLAIAATGSGPKGAA